METALILVGISFLLMLLGAIIAAPIAYKIGRTSAQLEMIFDAVEPEKQIPARREIDILEAAVLEEKSK